MPKRRKPKPYRLKTSKRCPECGSIVKKIKGRNTYYCQNHGFVRPYDYNPDTSRKGAKSEFRKMTEAIKRIWG